MCIAQRLTFFYYSQWLEEVNQLPSWNPSQTDRDSDLKQIENAFKDPEEKTAQRVS